MKLTELHSSRIEAIVKEALKACLPMMKQLKHHRRCEGGEECYCDEEEWVEDSQAARACAQSILRGLGKLESEIGNQ